jgi:bifunctional DNase/RNase
MREMAIEGIRVELPSNTPIVLLREVEGDGRVLPIFIGVPEATAIQLELEGEVPPRPMTHDLMRNILGELDVEVLKVVVTELVEKTFYADLHLVRDGETTVMSCRPSDALALAVRSGCPVYASLSVLDAAGHIPEPEPEEEEQVVDEFREFIDNVNPEDFGS